MCGIGGAIGIVRPEAGEAVQFMMRQMSHRGPNDEGFVEKGGVALGHRRLAVIDVAGGKQPVANEDGAIVVVFNGEIYNHHELRRELQAKGHVFRSSVDSEILPHWYEEYGSAGLAKLNGMFAFALHDRRKGEVLLARDRMGIKPLYYAVIGGSIYFASELRALAECPLVRPFLTLNREAIWHYISALYIPSPLTAYNEIRSLPPAHFVQVKGRETTERRYWSPPQIKPWGSLSEAAEEFEGLLADAVRLQLNSDVPLGAYLSGGVDSSLVVSSMAQLSSSTVSTFNVALDHGILNDGPYAAELARAFGTNHRVLSLGDVNVDLFDDLVARFGQPFADPSILPTYLISREISRHVTVALGGDGPDELFVGYDKYDAIAGKDLSPSVLDAIESGFFRVPRAMKHDIMRSDVCHMMPDTLEWMCGQAFFPTKSALQTMRQLDVRFFMESDILSKVDVLSMANSIEARVPLLDNRIVDFAWSLPEHLLIDEKRNKKLVLKEILAKRMSREFAERPKVGFTLPLSDWLAKHLDGMAQRITSSPALSALEMFEPDAAVVLLERYRAKVPKSENALFALNTLDRWLTRHWS